MPDEEGIREMHRKKCAVVGVMALLVSGVANAGPTPAGGYDDELRDEWRDDRYDEDARLQTTVSLGVDYSQGDYGDPSISRSGVAQAGLKLEYEPVTVRVYVPLLVSDGVLLDDAVGGTNGTEVGLGDIIASAVYTWYPSSRTLPTIDVIAKVKLPTASSSKGLGTGETDVTLGAEVSQTFGVVTLFAGGAYRFKGGGAFRDVLLATGGASVRFSQSLSAGVAYDFREASTGAVPDSHELSPFLSLRLSDHVKLTPYGVIGLSNGAPDWGVGSSIAYTF